MKRSQSIRLVLVGGLSAGALTGCGPSGNSTQTISTGAVYTNNYYVAGAGYYHAPFRDWYAQPYNHLDTNNGLYYQGGQWGKTPHESITNLSAPLPQAVQRALATHGTVRRGGFGSTAHHHFIHS